MDEEEGCCQQEQQLGQKHIAHMVAWESVGLGATGREGAGEVMGLTHQRSEDSTEHTDVILPC